MFEYVLKYVVWRCQLLDCLHVIDAQLNLAFVDVAVVAVNCKELFDQIGEQLRGEEEIPLLVHDFLIECKCPDDNEFYIETQLLKWAEFMDNPMEECRQSL